ncbi:hypothetical protein MLD38_028401 [Melastoma candidum]|uniref:Uncharacterized protein n=1 Tax=Melastoma candidum TaxID=119954 RepID=A0ACB9N3A1_9MYRT|nr:hypothetical protein MLD38_028401 [Melastoma candidum]
MAKEVSSSRVSGCVNGRYSSSDDESRTNSCYSSEKDVGIGICRVCQCVESDHSGDTALRFLGISPPPQEGLESQADMGVSKGVHDVKKEKYQAKSCAKDSGFIEIISPDGERFICTTDIEMGQPNPLMELGCACKNDLALVHYACALKWFVNHGSTVCEICGELAKTIQVSDFKKVIGSLKDYAVLRERTASGEPNLVQLPSDMTVDPDALAAIRRQRLSEISMWFSPHANAITTTSNIAALQAASDQLPVVVVEENVPSGNLATKWAVEGTGILLATGLLTIPLAWLIAPRVGKKTAKSGLHILLGGVCALTVVVFFRFFVLTRIKYGPLDVTGPSCSFSGFSCSAYGLQERAVLIWRDFVPQQWNALFRPHTKMMRVNNSVF